MIDPDDDNTSTAELLERCRSAQEDADKATAELAEAMRLHRFNRLADQLIEEFGPCPLPRADLLAWLADQIERIKAVGVPNSTAATAMIDAGYMELIPQHG